MLSAMKQMSPLQLLWNIKANCKAKKNTLNCFSGTATSVLKAPHYFFLLLSKTEKEKKTLFQFLNIIIGNDHVVSLGRCGLLPVMLASLFILDSISGIS